MHTIVVFTRRSRHEVVLGAWLADAVGRGEKVLVLRAPGEDASVLNRSLAAAGLDPSGVVGSGQVEMLDTPGGVRSPVGEPSACTSCTWVRCGGRTATGSPGWRSPETNADCVRWSGTTSS